MRDFDPTASEFISSGYIEYSRPGGKLYDPVTIATAVAPAAVASAAVARAVVVAAAAVVVASGRDASVAAAGTAVGVRSGRSGKGRGGDGRGGDGRGGDGRGGGDVSQHYNAATACRLLLCPMFQPRLPRDLAVSF